MALKKKNAKYTDQRGNMTSEFIKGIKMIKFNAWEKLIQTDFSKIRVLEKKTVVVQFIVQGLTDGITDLTPFIASILSFWLYNTYEGTLTIAQLFSVLTIYSSLIHPIKLYIYTLRLWLRTLVSTERIEKLNMIEQSQGLTDSLDLEKGQVQIRGDAMFKWDNDAIAKRYKADEKPKDGKKKEKEMEETKSAQNLSKVDLKVQNSEFLIVVGKVGSGKSSLMLSMMGELNLIQGEVLKNGRIAYIAQEAFLINETVRENITFGLPYVQQKYENVLKMCELVEDLKVLPAGDLTQIGERGINLSGGQKQRISIARAVYSDSDIYIIDDAMSALDSNVGKSIMENVFNGILKSKTKVMVTHKLELMKYADKAIIMEKLQIAAQGTVEEVKSTEAYKELQVEEQKNHEGQEDQENTSNEEEKIPDERMEHENKPHNVDTNSEQEENGGELSAEAAKEEENKKKLGKLNKEEKVGGNIGGDVYKFYCSKVGAFGITILAFLFTLFIALRFFADIWLAFWLENQLEFQNTNNYIYIYLGILGFTSIVIFIRSYSYGHFLSSASIKIAKEAIDSLLKRKMSFFDTTPSGQIINRCSGDVTITDWVMPGITWYFVTGFFQVIGAMVLVAVISPISLLVILLVLIYAGKTMLTYLKLMVSFERLKRVSMSPLISSLQEMIAGVSTIRVYGSLDYLKNKMVRRFDCLASAEYHERQTSTWSRVRVEYSILLITVVSIWLITLSDKIK